MRKPGGNSNWNSLASPQWEVVEKWLFEEPARTLLGWVCAKWTIRSLIMAVETSKNHLCSLKLAYIRIFRK
jgi:hypothetical protein